MHPQGCQILSLDALLFGLNHMPIEIGTPGRTLTIILGVQVGVLSVIHDIVRNKDGDNDGAVSVESARFDQRPENWTFLGTWPVNPSAKSTGERTFS